MNIFALVKIQKVAFLAYFIIILNCFEVFSSQIEVNQFHKIKGLNSKEVFNGFQSKYTRIYWFATGNGVVSYDGSKFDNFESSNPFFGTPSLKVIEDRQGFIWFISSNGQIGFFNGQKFSSPLVSAELESELSKGMVLDFWLNELNEIMVLCQSTFETKANLFKVATIPNNKFIVKKAEINTRQSQNIIFYYHQNRCIAYYNKMQRSYYKSIYVKNDTFFYNNQILTQLEKGHFVKELYKLDEKSLSNIQLVNNDLLMSTTDGLLIYKGLGKVDKLMSNINITSILTDVDSNVIICTLNEGIIISPKIRIEELDIGNSYGFSNIIIDSNNLYYSDKKYNLGVWNLNNYLLRIFINKDKSFSDKNIFIKDKVIYFNKKKFIVTNNFNQVSNITYIPFQYINNSKSNQFFLSTGYADVKIIEQNGKKFKSLFYGTRVYDAKAIRNKLWVATKIGLLTSNILNDENWILSDFDTFCKGYITERITSIGDKIVFITNKKYLSVLNGNELDKNILFGTIMENEIIKDFIFLDKRTLIVLTNMGMYVSELKWGRKVTIEKSKLISISNELVPDEYVSVDTFKNYLYFATVDKLYRVKLRDLRFNSKRRKCVVNSLQTNKRYFGHFELNGLRKIYLENDENNLEFNVVNSKLFRSSTLEDLKYTISYNGNSVFTRYLKSTLLRFENLKHGNYVLKIYTREDGSEWSIPFELEFKVKPKFHETKLFNIILISVSVIVTALLGFQIHKINKRKLMVRILEMENEKIQNQLLKSQLNPHFLFNSLNSLKSLIYLSKSNEAISFTDKLSGFLRAVLKFDSDVDISIENELELADHYLSIEKSRLGNRIKLEVDCPKNLMKTRIPSNILQPIIENSIKYGFVNTDHQLVIKIKIYQNGNIVQLLVEDNGKTIQNEDSNHSSFSLKSIEDRINSFNKGEIRKPLIKQIMFHEKEKVGFQVIISIVSPMMD